MNSPCSSTAYHQRSSRSCSLVKRQGFGSWASLFGSSTYSWTQPAACQPSVCFGRMKFPKASRCHVGPRIFGGKFSIVSSRSSVEVSMTRHLLSGPRRPQEGLLDLVGQVVWAGRRGAHSGRYRLRIGLRLPAGEELRLEGETEAPDANVGRHEAKASR